MDVQPSDPALDLRARTRRRSGCASERRSRRASSRPPGPDGRGLLSLAGAVVRARLPLGLHAGDQLRLRVAGQDGDQLVLRRVAEERPAARLPASVVAELAESGDGEQLRAALALAGGPIPLPGGRVLTVEPDGGGDDVREGERPRRGRCASSCTRRRSERSSSSWRCTAEPST